MGLILREKFERFWSFIRLSIISFHPTCLKPIELYKHSLVYGSETMLPIEIEIQYLRVLVKTKALEGNWRIERYEQLVLIDEKRMQALYYI